MREPADIESIRAAAADGRLPSYYRTGGAGIRAALYQLVADLVFQHLHQPLERARGHHRCAASPDRMDPECRDHYHDNVEAMLAHVLKQGDRPIANLEGWLVRGLKHVTIDAHRRRRGEQGAQQRPRLPRWLAAELATPWLRRLALEVMTWVGVPTPAGLGLWPLTAWTDLREQLTGELGAPEARTAADVETVLAAMRTNRAWYDRYVERPLGHKQAPVLPAWRGEDREPSHLLPMQRHEVDDTRLREQAARAVDAIAARLARGEDLEHVVVAEINAVFDAGTGADDLDRPPGTGPDDAQWVRTRLTDPGTVQRVAKTVTDIIRQRTPPPR